MQLRYICYQSLFVCDTNSANPQHFLKMVMQVYVSNSRAGIKLLPACAGVNVQILTSSHYEGCTCRTRDTSAIGWLLREGDVIGAGRVDRVE